MNIDFRPIEGRFVRMEPLRPEHKEELRAAGGEGEHGAQGAGIGV